MIGSKVFVQQHPRMGNGGTLLCLNTADGTTIWKKDFARDECDDPCEELVRFEYARQRWRSSVLAHGGMAPALCFTLTT